MANFPVREEQTSSILSELPVFINQARARRLSMAIVFMLIALLALGVGLLWPKSYVSSTTILVKEENIIQPLMEGRAVATGVADRALIAREVMFSRKILDEVLQEAGWLTTKTSPLQLERLAEDLKSSTAINSPGANLIRITHRDADAERAFKVARSFGDVFIRESLTAKERESREAYEFIAARVEEYHLKLTQAEDRLKEYRADNLEARPGTEADVTARVTEVRGRIEQARTNLSELQMRERALAEQLSGESEITSSQTRENQYRTRMSDLQSQLDTLLLSYTNEYPDVVRIRHQLEDLQTEIEAEGRRQQATAANPESAAELAQANPLYGQLRSSLSTTRSDIAMLGARISENEAILESELERGRRIADSEAMLSELTRDYEVNRDLYQDLLKRRENARVSMSLDAEHRGLTFRVQEPAALPLQPSGLQLMHFALAGLGLGVAVPLGLLFLLVRLDPRVRSASDLARELSVPVLVSVPQFFTPRQRRGEFLRFAASVVIVILVVAAYATIGWMRYTRAI